MELYRQKNTRKLNFFAWQNILQAFCLFCCCSADLKDEEEDVNDVDVEGKGSIDVLLWADGQLPIPDEELSVVHQKLKEDRKIFSRNHERPGFFSLSL